MALDRLRLARRRLGSWHEVGRRLRQYLAANGLAKTLARIGSYGAPLPGSVGNDVILRRYEAIRADVRHRIAAEPPVAPGSADIADGPLISIVMPVYRVPLGLLDKAIASVLRQSYPRWEFCIIDDGSDLPALVDRLRFHAAREPRIKLRLASGNAGIARASNQAIEMATGEYVGFLDHDDLLTHDALYWVACALVAEPDTDLVYTDECKIDDADGPDEIFCKPDWSPALLLNGMYLGHFAVYRRLLIDEVGGLRSRYDFSQDYDLALRATERAVAIRHVDRVLYCWRMVRGSAAAGGKSYARQSNIAALQDALDRRRYPAQAVALPTANRVRWDRAALRGKVSIVVSSAVADLLRDCVRSIREQTTYADYELIVVAPSAVVHEVAAELPRVRWLAFDGTDGAGKRNAGAEQADGEYVVFIDDDLRVITGEWLEALLECLGMAGVGAVGAKLLYADGTIRHAGGVTGVGRLGASAFHRLPGDAGVYFNFAVSLREVSFVSAACLAMPLALFRSLGGFDALNTPLANYDIDLSFRLRAAGYRCLATPYATLQQIAHDAQARDDDMGDAYLLRRWPDFLAYDPYYPPHLRALLDPEQPAVVGVSSERSCPG